MEPECKRQKLALEINGPNECVLETKPHNNMRINAILSDEYTKEIPTIKIIVGAIKDMKKISAIIDQLSRNLPLLDLQHLKRVRKNKIVLCKKDVVNELIKAEATDSQWNQCIHDYLIKHNIDQNIATELCSKLCVVEVASVQPKLRWQYEAMNILWPCKFHPNKYLEELYSNTSFREEEKSFHKEIMSAVKLLALNTSKNSTGICIDPRSKNIVAVASELIKVNPVLHCPMVLIDMVARTQNGGVWEYLEETFMENSEKLNFKGISKYDYQILRDSCKTLTFGAEMVDPNRKVCNLESGDQDNLSKYGPYLCTGYDVYMLEEPCLMCAMALIHSRVKRVFYNVNTPNGALGTRLKLHTVKDLNHHFEVFQIIDADDTENK